MRRPKHVSNKGRQIRTAPLRQRAAMMEELERRVMLSGVTIITHGFQPENLPAGWTTSLAQAIADRKGTAWDDISWYSMTIASVTGPHVQSFFKLGGPNPSQSFTGEVIVTVDWSELSALNAMLPTASGVIATQILPQLLATKSGLGGALAELPIHLIGHSRGASVMAELARQLGEHGIWVDQLTTLDPHPANSIGQGLDAGDAPVNIYDNVVFADNYWRQGGITSPNGKPILGAHNIQLNDNILNDEYYGTGVIVTPTQNPGYSGFADAHSDVHLWYHGTINGDNTDGYAQNFIGSRWYNTSYNVPNENRALTGYYYSRVVGGTRPSDGVWSPSNRVAVSVTAGSNAWDNVMITGFNGGSFAGGSPITVAPIWGDGNGDASITVGFDTDQNPYNGGAANTQTKAASPGVSFTLSTLGLPTLQNIYVYAKITNGTHTRYYYAPQKVTIDPAPPSDTTPPLVQLADPTNGSAIAISTINGRKYIDVSYSDAGSGLNLATITDAGQEFSISGLTINGTPSFVSGTTYRYSFTGSLPLGNISVVFAAGTFADSKGNLNLATTKTFNISSKPIITSVTPPVLPPLPAEQRQLITITGTGFNANSTLTFVSVNGTYTGRVPTYDTSTGQLYYEISVGPTLGNWTVTVITNGVASDPFPFSVSNLSPVATPTISPNGGSFEDEVDVTLSTSTPGAIIHYTLDGNDPTAGSALYAGPLTLGASLTLKARAFKSGMAESAVASASFNVTASPYEPVIDSVSPSLLQRTNEFQSIRVYGSGFQPGAVLRFYDPDGFQIDNSETDYVTSGRLDDMIKVGAKSGTWHVKVHNSDGWNSELYPFTVAESPTGNYPILISPSNGATGLPRKPTFQWQAVPGANLYRMIVAENPDHLPKDPFADSGIGDVTWNYAFTELQFEATSSLTTGKTYYWELKARINGVWNAWSPTWSFTIAGELNLPPVIQSASVASSVVTQGETLQFTAAGVADPNFAPDKVDRVIWYKEINGIPGYQPATHIPPLPNEADEVIASDLDGSDGWSKSISTYGDSATLLPGTHTMYAAARDTHKIYSAPTEALTITILPWIGPAPVVESFSFEPGVSPAIVRLTFNINLSQSPPTISNFILLSHLGSPFTLQGVQYDAGTRTTVLTLPFDLADGEYRLVTTSIDNPAGVGLDTWFYRFFVLAGDANQDRTVDSQDYTILLRNWNLVDKGWADGDFNADGMVNDADLQILEANIGVTLPQDTFGGAPEIPVNISPTDNTTAAELTPMLQASAFFDNQGHSHAASQWVVTRAVDSIVVFNSGDDPTNTLSISIGTLEPSTAYNWKVRYQDSNGIWSNYSVATSFTTPIAIISIVGDANWDGKVDAFDLNLLAAHWQQASDAAWVDGDFTGDGKVDAFDLNVLASHWQEGVPIGEPPLAGSVTEQTIPSTIQLAQVAISEPAASLNHEIVLPPDTSVDDSPSSAQPRTAASLLRYGPFHLKMSQSNTAGTRGSQLQPIAQNVPPESKTVVTYQERIAGPFVVVPRSILRHVDLVPMPRLSAVESVPLTSRGESFVKSLQLTKQRNTLTAKLLRPTSNLFFDDGSL